MAITRATNLAGLGTVFDALTDGGGLTISGISTFTDLNVTRVNVTGVSTSAQLNVGTGGTVITTTDAGLVGIGSTSPSTSLDVSQRTDAIGIPQGTISERPTGNSPYLRYNTTNNSLEFYNKSEWVEIITDYYPIGSSIFSQ